MKRLILSSLLSLCLIGCGGSVARNQPVKQAHLLVIGNSLTNYTAYAPLDWWGGWGMAASAKAKDYAHLIGAGLNIPVTAMNLAIIEQHPAESAATIQSVAATVDSATVVVVELGDNMNGNDIAAFQIAYDQLLKAVNSRAVLMCISSFWNSVERDAVIQPICSANGGTYVYIGDIRTDPENSDYNTGYQFSNIDVNHHPHDWGMAQIANRVVNMMQPAN